MTVRRACDVAAALLGLALLAPLFGLIALLVKVQDGGPVFYLARRVGQGGRLFRVCKFRTMTPDAAREGPPLTAAQDRRITPIGSVLRRHKLDEMPQLLNVLRGDMSLVGPRPEDPRYVALYTAEQRRVLAVPPGITGPASLVYRREESLLLNGELERTYVSEILPRKLAIDLEYAQTATPGRDIGIIVRTILAAIRG